MDKLILKQLQDDCLQLMDTIGAAAYELCETHNVDGIHDLIAEQRRLHRLAAHWERRYSKG